MFLVLFAAATVTSRARIVSVFGLYHRYGGLIPAASLMAFGALVVVLYAPAPDRPFLEDPPVESDAPQRIARIMAVLPERYRRILDLRFLQSCSLREAAQAHRDLEARKTTGSTILVP